MATKVIGLDFGSRSVKICESLATLRTTELIGYDSELIDVEPDQRPSTGALADAAQRLLARRGLLAETILCTPPSYMVSFVEIDLPFNTAKKIEPVIAFELDDRIPIDVEDVEFDYQIVRQDEQSSTCVVAFARRDHLGEFLDALNAVGIDPKEICFGPLILGSMPALTSPDEVAATTMLIDLGHHTTHVSVIGASGYEFVRDIPIGCSDVQKGLGRQFQLESGEAFKVLVDEGSLVGEATSERSMAIQRACIEGFNPLGREIKRTWISLGRRGVQPTRVRLVGGGSQIAGISSHLEASLKCSVQPMQPFEPRNAQATQRPDLRQFAKASALTNLKGSPKQGGRINLRQNEFSYTGDFSKIRGRLITTSLGVIVCLIMLAMLGIAKKRVLEAKHEQLKKEVARISKTVLGIETTEVSALTQALEEDFEADFIAIPQRSATELLHDISTQLPTSLKIDIDRIEINLERKSLVLRGKAPKPSDVEELTEALEKMKCFREVQQERVEAAGEESTRFRLSATASCQEGGAG